MDFDPRITSDGSDGAEHGWSCNFNFGHGHDVIDDDAQAQKCRMQALRLLIAKADAEIHDLEDELAILRCELKWVESHKQRDPYEVCCVAFKQKIDYLISSIQNLRNGNVSSRNAMNEALENQGSAERICDIINALISTNFSEPDEQSEGPELTSEETCSDVLRYATEYSKEDRYMAKSDDEGNREAEFDVYLCRSEGKSGFLTSKPVITPTHVQIILVVDSVSAVLKHDRWLRKLCTATDMLMFLYLSISHKHDGYGSFVGVLQRCPVQERLCQACFSSGNNQSSLGIQLMLVLNFVVSHRLVTDYEVEFFGGTV